MTALQSIQVWIGFGMAVFLILFFVVAFFKGRDLSEAQWGILRVLASLCAGFAGALIAGSSIFELSNKIGTGGNFAVSGTAGFALLFTVWFTFPTTPKAPPAEDSFGFSVPAGWTFEQTADALAGEDDSVVEFVGFTPKELAAPLKERKLTTKTVAEALENLGAIVVKQGIIRQYDVRRSNSKYELKIRS